MSPHWHTYWTNPGESGQATQIKLSGPAGLKFGEIQWPLPAKIEAPGGFSYGYEDSVLLMIPVTAAKDFAASSPADISADVSWLSCSGDQCVEGSAKLKIALSAATEARPANAGLFEQWRGKLPTPLDKTTGLEVTQKMSDKGPLPELELRWKQPPGKVEWYPETMPSIAIENVAVKHAGPTTTIAYKLTVFKSAEIGDGVVHGVVVYEDDKGRHGLRFPFRVAKEK
jgi:thiol:disulfide interchange protein DsbD